MKTLTLKIILSGSILLLLFSNTYAQSQYLGNWEGLFMNDFKTNIELNSDGYDGFSGIIKMYNGKNLIQNDQLSKITFTDNKLTFYIDSKQTKFKGEFSSGVFELKGEFIFPDQSEHPIILKKNFLKKDPLIDETKASYSVLKNKKFTIIEQEEDFNYLIEKLEEYHPKLYTYTTKEYYDELISKSLQNMNSELTLVEFFNFIAPVVERIKCSHTGIRLPQSFQEGIYSNENFLPLKLLFEGEKVFCLRNLGSDSQLVPGSEIVSINNVPIQQIKEQLCILIPSEGNNTTTKEYYLNQNFNSLFNLIDNSQVFIVEYKNLKSAHFASIQACKFSELGNIQSSTENEKPISFLFNEKKRIGFLTVRSFMYPDINRYILEMDTIFSTLQSNNAKHLVIDLRGNSGGHPIFAAQLLSYLTDKDFTYFERNDNVVEFEPLYNQMSSNKLHFEGDIYVLTDGGCLSTTGHLISLIKHYSNATFIGQEPGSTFQCNDFSVKETLPNTGIEVNIPRTTFETAVSQSEKTLQFTVDYQVSPSIEDYLKGEDAYIKLVYQLISVAYTNPERGSSLDPK